jgi:carotenoid cleavage dioxygenase-like enzyme
MPYLQNHAGLLLLLAAAARAFTRPPALAARGQALQRVRMADAASAAAPGSTVPATITAARIEAAVRETRGRHTAESARQIYALFDPFTREQVPVKVALRGALPPDLPGGAYLRIGPNPRPGRKEPGFLDADGMLLSIVIRPPEERADHCLFSSAWVRTAGFQKEEAAGGDLFQGTLGAAPRGWPVLAAVINNFVRGKQAVKDTCNTAVSYHAGKILALMEQCRPSEVRVSKTGELRTIKALSDLNGSIPFDPLTGGALGAHSRVDPSTGEKIAVSYATGGPGQGPPTARHDVWNAKGKLTHSVTVPLPAPIMIHDLAITPSLSVIFDLPLTVRIEKAFLDRFLVEYEKDTPGRLGLLPRYASSSNQVQWFDVEAGVVLHACNAYHDAQGRVVVQAFRAVPADPTAYIAKFTPAFPYQWILDPATGRCVEERYLSDTPTEFPNMSPHMHGREASYCYALSLSSAGGVIDGQPVTPYRMPQESPRFDSLVKVDLKRGGIAQQFHLPRHSLFVSEPIFVHRSQGLFRVQGSVHPLCVRAYLAPQLPLL